MKVNSVLRRNLVLVSIVACALFMTGATQAAEFSARLVTQTQTVNSKGRMAPGETSTKMVYVKGEKRRIEYTAGAGKIAVIVRPDKNVSWMVNWKTKTYMEAPITGLMAGKRSLASRITQEFPKARRMGTATINGLRCEKLEVQSLSPATKGKKPQRMVLDFYVNDTVEFFPVKQVVRSPWETSVTDCRDIKKQSVADSLFEIPHGFKKVAIPKPRVKK